MPATLMIYDRIDWDANDDISLELAVNGRRHGRIRKVQPKPPGRILCAQFKVGQRATRGKSQAQLR